MCSAWRPSSFLIISLMAAIPPSARVSLVEKLRAVASAKAEGTGSERNELGVASSSVPLSLERLGVKGDGDSPLLSDADEEEPVARRQRGDRSKAERERTNLAIQRWSPMSLPGQGPTWNSH